MSSLLIADPASGKRWLIDATPDFREQVAAPRATPGGDRCARSSGRPPLFEAILLTHAHMGHYTGLLQLGREAYAAEGQRVAASASMSAFLEKNAPWELLVRLGHIRLETFSAGAQIVLAPGLSITPIAVPHRAEYTDTYAFLIRGPHRTALYLPDIDRWEAWDRKLEDVLHRVDLAFLDGTFFDERELPGRKLEEIPHPLIRLTLERLAALPENERRKVIFIHLNHSNPAADPHSAARRAIEAARMNVAAEGQREDPLMRD